MEQRQHISGAGGQPMKIAVCMKQVPAASEGDMDPETGVLLRSGLEPVVNVYDMAALEAALRIKEESGAVIHVFTMGPAKAESVLREAYAMGADEGFLICDRGFAGADVLATSYTLSQAIWTAGKYDMIICGKQTTDGDTAQVSGALAKWMGILHINWVSSIPHVSRDFVKVKYMMQDRIVTAKAGLPCLLSVEKESFVPRMPSLRLKISGKKKAIHSIAMADLADQDSAHYGLAGSATRVRSIFPPMRTKKKELIQRDVKSAAEYILGILGRDMQGEAR